MSSRRRYATIEEVEELAEVTSTNDTEFEDRISQAEELIDAYVGYQDRSFSGVHQGRVTSATDSTLVDTRSVSPLFIDNNYYQYCVVEIIAGTGSGQIRFITGSDKEDRSLTIDVNWTTNPDDTSIYKIYQLGKFPRYKDLYYDNDLLTYYKSIPEAVKRATAAQLQFMIEKGDDYFAGDDSTKDSESIDNYSYSRGGAGAQASIIRLLAPRARTLLRGYKNSTGRIIADNPTSL